MGDDDVKAMGELGIETIRGFCDVFKIDFDKLMQTVGKMGEAQTDTRATAQAAFVAGALFVLQNQIGGRVTDKHARQR